MTTASAGLETNDARVLRQSRITDLSIWILATVAAFAWAILPQADTAEANHSFGYGDCWSGASVQCAANWAASTNYGYKVVPFWTGSMQTEANASLTAAMYSWTTSAGPQVFSTSTPSNPYMIVFTFPWPTYSTPDPVYTTALNNGAIAVTANFSTSSTWCFTYPCVIDHSGIYYNTNARANCSPSGTWSAFTWQYIFAHEFGHSQGLDDHSSGNILMNLSWTTNYPCSPNTAANGPTSDEVGYPVHSADTSCGAVRGVQCIFKWPNN